MQPENALVERLRRRAVEVASSSYSPYSRFPVGAAVASRGGEIYVGCNVENASFGLTQCAERAALMPLTGITDAGALELVRGQIEDGIVHRILDYSIQLRQARTRIQQLSNRDTLTGVADPNTRSRAGRLAGTIA